MELLCRQCAQPFTAEGARGRTPTYCSTRCRVAAYREREASSFPVEMMGKRWTRADGKRPIMVDGAPASSTNPNTWTAYDQVATGDGLAGDGYGIMLGDGVGCYDFDNVFNVDGTLTGAAKVAVSNIREPILYAERSISGRGMHIFVTASECPGYRVPLSGGGSVERYTRERFIRVTGDRVEVSQYV